MKKVGCFVFGMVVGIIVALFGAHYYQRVKDMDLLMDEAAKQRGALQQLAAKHNEAVNRTQKLDRDLAAARAEVVELKKQIKAAVPAAQTESGE